MAMCEALRKFLLCGLFGDCLAVVYQCQMGEGNKSKQTNNTPSTRQDKRCDELPGNVHYLFNCDKNKYMEKVISMNLNRFFFKINNQ